MSVAYQDATIQILLGDALAALKTMPDSYVQTCVTSPPYWGLRNYGVQGQMGLEKTPEEYVEKMVEVFREVRLVLKDDGTLWLNLGDSYAGSWGNYHPNSPPGKHGQRLKETARWNRPAYQSQDFLPPTAQIKGLKPKDMVGIPWRVAFALQADGWYLRSDIIWSKPNPMPESVVDRPTKSHEYIFLLSKSERYFYDHEAIKEPASYAEEAKYDPGTNGLGGDDRKTGKTTRRFAGTDKQRGHSRRHAGFNDRWDQMTETEQCSGMRNKRSVWTIATEPFPDAHFATFPTKLIEPCILAGSRPGDLVLDPFAGAGTTLLVAKRLGRRACGIELNPEYVAMIQTRLTTETEALPL